MTAKALNSHEAPCSPPRAGRTFLNARKPRVSGTSDAPSCRLDTERSVKHTQAGGENPGTSFSFRPERKLEAGELKQIRAVHRLLSTWAERQPPEVRRAAEHVLFELNLFILNRRLLNGVPQQLAQHIEALAHAVGLGTQ